MSQHNFQKSWAIEIIHLWNMTARRAEDTPDLREIYRISRLCIDYFCRFTRTSCFTTSSLTLSEIGNTKGFSAVGNRLGMFFKGKRGKSKTRCKGFCCYSGWPFRFIHVMISHLGILDKAPSCCISMLLVCDHDMVFQRARWRIRASQAAGLLLPPHWQNPDAI